MRRVRIHFMQVGLHTLRLVRSTDWPRKEMLDGNSLSVSSSGVSMTALSNLTCQTNRCEHQFDKIGQFTWPIAFVKNRQWTPAQAITSQIVLQPE